MMYKIMHRHENKGKKIGNIFQILQASRIKTEICKVVTHSAHRTSLKENP